MRLPRRPSPATPTGAEQYLLVPNGATNMTVSQNGMVSYVPAAGGPREVAGYISLAKFANESGLERAASNLWRVSGSSGPEIPAGGATPGLEGVGLTISGTVEMSNVDLAAEFTNLILAQRGFQASSRVITTSDQVLEDLVNLQR